MTVTGGVFLVLSNIFLFPVILISLIYGLIPEATISIVVFLESTTYHVCQAGWFCLFTFNAHQTSDHFFVFSLLVWFVFYFIGIRLKYRVGLFMLAQGALLPALIDLLHSWWVGGTLLVAMVLVGMVGISMIVPNRFKLHMADFLIAVFLVGGGFFFHVYAGDPGAVHYEWSHSIWHALGMLGPYFIVEARSGSGLIHRITRRFKKKKRHSSPV
jgi:hypothetical protein